MTTLAPVQIRRLLLRTGRTTQILAELTMRGESLRVRWHDPTIQAVMETVGLLGPDGSVRPSDGRAFYEALKGAFSSNGSLFVDDVESVRQTLS